MKLNVQGDLKCWLWRLASLLQADHKFNGGITGLRKAEKMAMTMLVHRITIREVADDVGISSGSCQAIFTEVLGMKRTAEKIVPKLLNFEQKQRRMGIA